MITSPLPRLTARTEALPASGVPRGVDARSGAGRGHVVALGIGLAVLLTAAFAAIYVFFVRTVPGQALDENAMVGGMLLLRDHVWARAASGGINAIPETVGVLGALGVLLSAAIGRRWRTPAIGVAAGLLAMLATQVLKHLVLTRPDLNQSQATMNSFPSGHTTAAAAAMLALLLAAPPAARGVLGIIAAVASAAAGSATILMGWHRPSDVIGALIVVAFFGVLAAIPVRLIDVARPRGLLGRRDPQRVRGSRAGTVTLVVLGLVLVAVATVLAQPLPGGTEALATGLQQATTTGATRAMVCGICSVAGASLVTLPLVAMVATPSRRR